VSAVLPRVARAAPLLSVVCGQGLASATSFVSANPRFVGLDRGSCNEDAFEARVDFCETGPLGRMLPPGGRLPERRCRSIAGATPSCGNCVDTCSAASARACSNRAMETFSTWFDARASFSSVFSSSSWKTVHHSPLPSASLGALSRHGSATSQCAASGALARR